MGSQRMALRCNSGLLVMRYPATGEARYTSTAGVTRLQRRLNRVDRIKQFLVAILREFGSL
jgi:hypothetical protein